jgi:hypothetical protein
MKFKFQMIAELRRELEHQTATYQEIEHHPTLDTTSQHIKNTSLNPMLSQT